MVNWLKPVSGSSQLFERWNGPQGDLGMTECERPFRSDAASGESPGRPTPARLLPWVGEGGRPAYLLGGGRGTIGRIADGIESVQLDMAHELLGHAAELLRDDSVTGPELHFLASRLGESLRQVARIAESRGASACSG